jgi:DNA-binding SARP family transcriptional activator
MGTRQGTSARQAASRGAGRPAARAAEPILEARLFGSLDLRLGDVPLPPLGSARAESLLAYLLLHRDAPQPRQRLAFLLWPDSTERQAQTNLRHVLHTLRRALPEADRFVEATPRTLGWRAGAPLRLDVASFEEALGRAASAPETALAALEEAAGLYTGDLLEGSYDDWVLERREHLRQLHLEALERLARLYEERGDPGRAVPHAERLLRQDPLREETYRLLMRLHDARGDRARALRVYHACTATLERELGVQPSAATREVYETLLPADGGAEARETAAGTPAGATLVGRTAERKRLAELWREAEGGRAGFVLVKGEPGIGKTRLLEELRTWCEHRGALTATARSYAAEGALAYGPVVAWLRSDGLAARSGRLEPARRADLARLLPELAEPGGAVRLEPLSESEQRQRLFDALAHALLGSGPLLLVADDLHWADRETLQFLHYLLRSKPCAPLLVAASARSEELDPQHPASELLAGLRALDRCSEIELRRLSAEEVAVLAERTTGRRLEERDTARLHEETAGNPLFVLEALRAGWTGGGGPRPLTPRVQSVIESRLAQLSAPARDHAGVAAAIGREFTSTLLAAAVEADEEAIAASLDELWRRRIIQEHGADFYDFSHDTIREVAYGSLSPARRRRHHLAVARALERLHEHDPLPVSAQLASHYDRAGAAQEAIRWYAEAAAEAQRVSANLEAARLLGRGLELAVALPPSRARDEQELRLLMALVAPLGNVAGWVDERLGEAQRRALALTAALGDEPPPPLLRSLGLTRLSQGRLAEAAEAGRQLHARGERDGDELVLAESNYILGISAFWQGQLEAARHHFESAVAGYRPEFRPAHLVQYGFDTKAVCLSRLANTLWFLGFPQAAVDARDGALALTEGAGDPDGQGIVLVFAATLVLDMRDDEGLRLYTAALRGWQEHHESRALALAFRGLEGYVEILDGRPSGLAHIQSALLDASVAEHAPGQRTALVRALLEGCVAADEPGTGIEAADAWLAGTGARLWEPEIRRLRAEFLAALGGPPGEVRAELARARSAALAHGAKSLELRIATSALRLAGDRKERERARRQLAAVLAGFPDETPTRDLADAEALLAG